MKNKLKKLQTGSIIAFIIGIPLWIAVGPSIANIGIVYNSGDHKWSFFQAYSWLSGYSWLDGSEPLNVEVTSVYWVGVLISIIGFFVFAVGLIGVTLTFLLKTWKKVDLDKSS
ncbi:hypothetical protein C0199_01780 [Candidatus Bathyarchaeota archaeon]|nr:MAG: hypothetical protein C0199_01780 [Candidatus Bathyarchaeota archaeon]